MSLEETVSDERVRGRFEEVEMRDLGVPLNILDREDEREDCFNLEEEIVGELMGYETSLGNKSSLAHLVENYEVLGHVLMRPARRRERACLALGDHWMPLYSHYLVAGLWFLILDLLVWLLMEYGLGLTQLTSNAVRLVRAFPVYGRVQGVSFPTMSVFKYFYVLNAGSGEMNKFLEAAGGVGIPKKGKGKRIEVGRRGEGASVPQAEVTEPAASSLPNEVGPSATAANVATAFHEQGYICLHTTSFYDFGMRSTAKRFINTYFLEVDRQWAKDVVVARGSVGVVRQALEAVNLMNVLANDHHESLRDKNQMRKENAKLVKKNEEAEVEVAKLKAEMEELKKENTTLKKDSELSYEKRKICENELEKKEKELDKVAKAAVELEFKVHNFVEEHVEGFLKSSTFEDIDLDVDVRTITFGDQVGKVEENGESSIANFHPKVTLKWDKESRARTILPPKFSFEFVVMGDKGTEGADNLDQPVE
ncbi:hypothetical protein SLEP1_g9508 [Rubroshorea leprosula]|uniref:Uncharacterized protein n=1 Tax=Rubroshorea leprosula TaxID=152421 RepID=A0AAV5IDK1_9ROSI|nr:hypothetical protein SLEP1_g9508 [Rubroshorea leprosula]